MQTRTSLILGLCSLLLTFSCTTEDEIIPVQADFESTELPTNIKLIEIPAGTFTMGGAIKVGDAPTVSVTLSKFQISEKETTNQEYIDFLNSTYLDGWISVSSKSVSDPCGTSTENVVLGAGSIPNAGEVFIQLGETGGCTSDRVPEHIDNKSWISFNSASSTFELLDADKADWPVNWVKWYGAYAYAQYYGVSLPTEAQWEYAARGGKQVEHPTDDGTLSPSKANYNGDTPGVYNADGHSVEVGTYAANSYGLYDMGGNVGNGAKTTTVHHSTQMALLTL